jgi:hypothetical protein
MVVFLLAFVSALTLNAQTCPADLEWHGVTAPPPTSLSWPAVTSNAPTSITSNTLTWPPLMIPTSVVTDRSPSARVPLGEPAVAALPVAGRICDPVFGTSITRVTPAGYGLNHQEPFSAGGGWFLSVGPFGAPSVFQFDKTTGNVKMAAGKPVSIQIHPEMVPQSPWGTWCDLGNVFWSTKEEGVIYIVACGTRIFKYNLALYSPTNPRAGLVAGTNRRSVASWPPCPAGNCRTGPIFIDLTDIFYKVSKDGKEGGLDLRISDNDSTFAGYTRRGGYKNAQGLFAYKPATNYLWYAVGAAGTNGAPDPFFMLTSPWNGAPVNKRILGSNLDYSGNFFGMQICSDPVPNYDGCNSGISYVVDLRVASRAVPLNRAVLAAKDDGSHPGWADSKSLGAAGITQNLLVTYFDGANNTRALPLPDLFVPNGWWSSYTAATSNVTGPSGEQLAGVLSTFSYERLGTSPTPLSSCLSRKCTYANELILFNLAGTHFLRLTHTRSKIDDPFVQYWDLPRVALSRDGQYALFSSNWGTPSTTAVSNFSLYMVRLPGAWQQFLDDRVTMVPSTASAAPGEYEDLTFGHLRKNQSAEVLIQDRSLTRPNTAGACYFRVSQNGTIYLANDAGTMTQAFGTLGYPLSPVLENSQCRIDVANSRIVPTSPHLNVEYAIRVFFKDKWAGKSLRANMTNLPNTDWRDVGQFNVENTAMKWLPIPGAAPVTVSGNQLWSTAYYATGYSSSRMTVGKYFEFKVQDPVENFFVNLNPTPPASHLSFFLFSTLRVARNSSGQREVFISENNGGTQFGSIQNVKAGDTLRITNVGGYLQYSHNGIVVAMGKTPAPAELFACLNMSIPDSRISDWVLQ